jgi:hypothetical protein
VWWSKARQAPGRLWRNPTYRGVGILSAVALYFVVPIVAPYALGARGDLLALAFEWLIIVALSALFAGLCFLFFAGVENGFRWAIFCGFLIFASLCLFSIYEVGVSGADTFLPFRERDVLISGTYYEEPQTGRGALPDTGGWHLVTPDGDDYRVRESGDGDSVHVGAYRLKLSYFKHLVMSEAQR